MLERHTYDLATSPHTNCVRCFKTVKGTHEAPCKNGLRCFERWGWAIAKYVNGPACEQSANDAGARESLVAAAAVMAERNAGRQWLPRAFVAQRERERALYATTYGSGRHRGRRSLIWRFQTNDLA